MIEQQYIILGQPVSNKLYEDYMALHLRVLECEMILSLIASPMRADGTYNRDRAACQKLAEDALSKKIS